MNGVYIASDTHAVEHPCVRVWCYLLPSISLQPALQCLTANLANPSTHLSLQTPRAPFFECPTQTSCI